MKKENFPERLFNILGFFILLVASILSFILSILVASGLYYSIHMIKEANDETKKIQK